MNLTERYISNPFEKLLQEIEDNRIDNHLYTNILEWKRYGYDVEMKNYETVEDIRKHLERHTIHQDT